EIARRPTTRFDYDPVVKRMKATIDKGMVLHIELDDRLKYMLGFDNNQLWTSSEAKYHPDIKAGMHSMFINCNIVVPQYIGDVQSQVIKIVPLKGEWGSHVNVEYPNVHYVDVLTHRFDRISISIKGDDGNPIEFDYGKVLIILHF
ncbi:MAG: hypothetical protein GY751_25020, partial [Bacteroidetes bacterium]|nr:hypothetical protein [Bacteroidota bacterium]